MSTFTKVFILILLFIVAWVLVEMWAKKHHQRKLAREIAERNTDRRLHDVLFGPDDRRRTVTVADAFIQKRQDESAD